MHTSSLPCRTPLEDLTLLGDLPLQLLWHPCRLCVLATRPYIPGVYGREAKTESLLGCPSRCKGRSPSRVVPCMSTALVIGTRLDLAQDTYQDLRPLARTVDDLRAEDMCWQFQPQYAIYSCYILKSTCGHMQSSLPPGRKKPIPS